eukprot:2665346-Prymnesium_polylepis.1
MTGAASPWPAKRLQPSPMAWAHRARPLLAWGGEGAEGSARGRSIRPRAAAGGTWRAAGRASRARTTLTAGAARGTRAPRARCAGRAPWRLRPRRRAATRTRCGPPRRRAARGELRLERVRRPPLVHVEEDDRRPRVFRGAAQPALPLVEAAVALDQHILVNRDESIGELCSEWWAASREST